MTIKSFYLKQDSTIHRICFHRFYCIYNTKNAEIPFYYFNHFETSPHTIDNIVQLAFPKFRSTIYKNFQE